MASLHTHKCNVPMPMSGFYGIPSLTMEDQGNLVQMRDESSAKAASTTSSFQLCNIRFETFSKQHCNFVSGVLCQLHNLGSFLLFEGEGLLRDLP